MSCHINSTQSNSSVFNGHNFVQHNVSVVSIYSECNTSIPGGKPLGNNHQISCNLNSTQSDGYFYRTRLMAQKAFSSLNQCNNHIIVPVNQPSAEQLASSNATESDLRSALTSGFNLEWMANNKLCDQCMLSEGRCGSSDTLPYLFACYCANGKFSITCNDTNQSEGKRFVHRQFETLVFSR